MDLKKLCGIIGVTANKSLKAFPVLFSGLKRLEYRGYDSYGFALLTENPGLLVETAIGQIGEADLNLRIGSYTGIAHTRWATHGGVTENNAHPQVSCNRKIAVVHNGILTNYLELRDRLVALGHDFRSETDTETIPHLIEEYMNKGYDFFKATQLTVKELGSEGAYAFAAVCEDDQDTIIFAKNRSPLVVGIGEGSNFIASAEVAFLEFTRKLVALEDMSVGRITPNSVEIYDIEGKLISLEGRIQISNWSIEEAQKGGFEHFMLKEIHEQSHAIRNTLHSLDKTVQNRIIEQLNDSDEIFLVACGTSYHSCLCGEFLFEKLAKMRTRSILPNTLESKIILPKSLLIAVSQSGETADTISAIDYSMKEGATIAAIVNNVGTQIPRMAGDLCLYTHAGPEIGVAATKTFTTQVLAFTSLAIEAAYNRKTISQEKYDDLKKELLELPSIVNSVIRRTEYKARKIGKQIRYKKSAYFLGTSTSLPVAMEGALKLKEIAYVHAEGYNAAESKHGPIALIEDDFPVVFICPNDKTKNHLLGNIREMSARGAYTIVIHEGDENVERVADLSIKIPELRNSELAFIPQSVVTQLIAYYAAAGKLLNGIPINPDKPKNLAKSVTVT